MTPNEFVIWLKGFIQASNKYNVTPKQWDDIKDQLNKVNLNDNTYKYSVIEDKNCSVSFSNSSEKNTESTVTYGRPEDSITYTTK